MNEQYRNAIGTVESGNDYAALGPVTDSGDRAYGRYQVMGNNIPEWTKRHLGTAMTPEQFLADKAAQDKVFDGETSAAYKKHGNLDDVTSTWFSGRPVAQAGNASDGYNTVPQYLSKVNKVLGAPSGPAAINAAAGIPPSPGPGAMTSAFAKTGDDNTGALTPQPGALTAAPETNKANVIGQGLTGIGAALAGISSPAQSQALTQQMVAMQKPATQGDWSVHVLPNGQVMRINNKTAQSQLLPGNYAKPDDKYADARAKANSDLYDKIGQDSADAAQGMSNVGHMRQALSDPNVYQGNGGEAWAAAKGYMKALGMNVAGVENSQVVNSLHNQLTLAARKVDGMPGSLSDSDRNFLSAIAPGLNNNPETNAKLLGYMEQMYQRKQKIGQMRDDYVKEHGQLDDGFTQEVNKYVSSNNLFGKAPTSLPQGVNGIKVITP